MSDPATAAAAAAASARAPSPRLSPRLTEDLRRISPVWDEEFEQLTRSMQERMDDFFRAPPPPAPAVLDPAAPGGVAVVSDARGRIETQPDGSLVYRVTFDVRGYRPGDLKTSLISDRTVRVSGSSNRTDPQTGKQTSASFDEQFTLPDNVDPAKLRSVVSNDQLIVSAPVLPPQYARTVTLQQHQQQSQSQHRQQQQLFTAPGGSPGRLSPRSASPGIVGVGGVGGVGVRSASAFQLEVDVGREFEPQDLTVATAEGGRRLTVHGRREVKAAGKTSMREFRDEFDLPDCVDVGRVTARLRSDGRVIVDMPLLRETAGFTYWPVAVEHRS